MVDMFVAALIILILACVAIHFYTRQVQQQVKDTNYRGFQQTYLLVYLLAVGENCVLFCEKYFFRWFSQRAIGFKDHMSTHCMKVMALENMKSKFCLSLVLVHRWFSELLSHHLLINSKCHLFFCFFSPKNETRCFSGRRNTCLVYGILYGTSCVTKVSIVVRETLFRTPFFCLLAFCEFSYSLRWTFTCWYGDIDSIQRIWIMASQRTSTSKPSSFSIISNDWFFLRREIWNRKQWVLYLPMHTSAIQSWLFSRVLSLRWLRPHLAMCKNTFARQFLSRCSSRHFSAPFDSAILTFIAMFILLITTWSENYGDANAPISQSFISGWEVIKAGRNHRCVLRLEKSIFVFR